MELGLRGRVAVVTGGSAGIGLATATVLAAEGVNLHLVARRRELLEDVAARLRINGINVTVQSTDMLDPAAAGAIAAEVSQHHPTVDILVNNAGGSRPVALDAPGAEWEEALRLKFHAYRDLAHALLPMMIRQGFGRIVNVTGTSEPPHLNASHSASAATHAWAKGLSRVVGRHGITVNSVPPSSVMSEQTMEKNWPDEKLREEHAQQNISVGHFGDPAVVARTIAYLVSPHTNFITGEVVHVDGGLRRFAF